MKKIIILSTAAAAFFVITVVFADTSSSLNLSGTEKNSIESATGSVKPASSINTTSAEAATQANPVSDCAVPDEFIKNYNRLILELRKVEEAGDVEQTELTTEKIRNLKIEMEKIRVQCGSQYAAVEPVRPTAVESGQEISDYYRVKIENITDSGTAGAQIENLKSLKVEVDGLVSGLIEGKKEIEASELSNAVAEIKVRAGEITADDVSVRTTDKRILVNVGDKTMSVMPADRQVMILDGDLEVSAPEVSIRDNVLRVGNSEVKMAASEVAERLNIIPQSAELAEDSARAIYRFKVLEKRKLFGFIPLQITKTLTADAENSDLLGEQLPWYSFLTTK